LGRKLRLSQGQWALGCGEVGRKGGGGGGEQAFQLRDVTGPL